MLVIVKQAVKSLIPPRLRPAQVAARMFQQMEADGVIVAGLFRGLTYPRESVCSAIWPKRLGIYEIELADIFRRLPPSEVSTVINVGAAEGYYALGCARLWPDSRVIAYEQDATGRTLLQQYARKNGLQARVDCRGLCTAEELHDTLCAAGEGLLLMDVEGAEDELLAGPNVAALAGFHVIVELHDLRRERLTEKMRERFGGSHRLEEIWTRPRRFSDFPFPGNPLLRLYLLEQLKAAADERRGAPMRWLMMSPLRRLDPNSTNPVS